MRALVTAAIAAIEAVAVALATLLIVAIFACVVWWVSFDMSAEPTDVLAAAGSVWLLAHFVPIAFELGPETVQQFGFAPQELRFTLSLVPLGVTALTVAFAARSGWRFGSRGGSGAAGVLGGALGFGAAAFVIDMFSTQSDTPLAVSLLVPAAVYGVAVGVPFVLRAVREQQSWWLRVVEACETWLGKMRVPRPVVVVRLCGDALKLGVMLVASYVALAAAGVAVAIVIGYTGIIAASQALQLDAWGAIMLFVVQLALLPTLVIWSGAWFTGAGFSVGVGSTASPFGALLGPMPGVPLLSAIPDGWGAFAALAPVLLVLAGLVAGAGLGNVARRYTLTQVFSVGVAGAVFAGLGVAVLNAVASGSLGPGRLEAVGPGVWMVAGIAAAELGVGGLLGAFAARADLARRAVAVPEAALRKFGGADEDAVAEWSTAARAAASTVENTVENTAENTAENTDANATVPLDIDLSQSVTDLSTKLEAKLETLIETQQSAESASEAELETPGEEPAQPVREPELYDQHETDVIEPLAENDPAASAGTSSVAGGVSAPDLDPDALVEAYSWDAISEEGAVEQPERAKRNWKWPGRKG